MRKILVAALIGLGVTALHAGDSRRSWVEFDCGSHSLHFRVGGDPSSIDVRQDRDGLIYAAGADGDLVVASCARGCLELGGKAACSSSFRNVDLSAASHDGAACDTDFGNPAVTPLRGQVQSAGASHLDTLAHVPLEGRVFLVVQRRQ